VTRTLLGGVFGALLVAGSNAGVVVSFAKDNVCTNNHVHIRRPSNGGEFKAPFDSIHVESASRYAIGHRRAIVLPWQTATLCHLCHTLLGVADWHGEVEPQACISRWSYKTRSIREVGNRATE
jgi:hypothetical protein